MSGANAMQAGNDFVLWNNTEDWQTTGKYCLRGATQQCTHHCLFLPQQTPKSVSRSRQICLQVQTKLVKTLIITCFSPFCIIDEKLLCCYLCGLFKPVSTSCCFDIQKVFQKSYNLTNMFVYKVNNSRVKE